MEQQNRVVIAAMMLQMLVQMTKGDSLAATKEFAAEQAVQMADELMPLVLPQQVNVKKKCAIC